MPSNVAAYRSFRLSIRWLPEEASEPTSTIVLTAAKSGVFLDTRFYKGSSEIEWAFAGYRSTDPGFALHTSSEEAEDSGTNTTLPDGTTLEVGEMVNFETGKMTQFEEIWTDEEETDGQTVLFVKNASGTTWQARAGNWQLALGRAEGGVFWAWQAEKTPGGEWQTRYSSKSGKEGRGAVFLPEDGALEGWEEESSVEWEGDVWVVLERGRK
ncbi:hypothetical protein DXG03_005961 [Asterophora parasitica]|uniref:Protein HRI1 n=1 Tax=Asterophora parasitica TaxID=117018 RepID=A0A9P7G188_9AGAR|nr:hypothetical protein DXG03_005961 [Asterophora parasitica]